MNNKIKNIYIVSIFGIYAITSCSNQLVVKDKTDQTITDNIKIIKTNRSSNSLYKNIRNINGGEKLIFHFNLNSDQPHPNTTKNRNNAKKTVMSDYTIQADNYQLAVKKLPHRN